MSAEKCKVRQICDGEADKRARVILRGSEQVLRSYYYSRLKDWRCVRWQVFASRAYMSGIRIFLLANKQAVRARAFSKWLRFYERRLAAKGAAPPVSRQVSRASAAPVQPPRGTEKRPAPAGAAKMPPPAPAQPPSAAVARGAAPGTTYMRPTPGELAQSLRDAQADAERSPRRRAERAEAARLAALQASQSRQGYTSAPPATHPGAAPMTAEQQKAAALAQSLRDAQADAARSPRRQAGLPPL